MRLLRTRRRFLVWRLPPSTSSGSDSGTKLLRPLLLVNLEEVFGEVNLEEVFGKDFARLIAFCISSLIIIVNNPLSCIIFEFLFNVSL